MAINVVISWPTSGPNSNQGPNGGVPGNGAFYAWGMFTGGMPAQQPTAVLYQGAGLQGQQIGLGNRAPPPAPCNWAFYFQDLAQYVGQQVTLLVSVPGGNSSYVTFYLAGAYSKPEGDSRRAKGNRKK